ncbi:Pxr1, partial [Ophiophagus hannah]
MEKVRTEGPRTASKKCYRSTKPVVKKHLPVQLNTYFFFFLPTISCSDDQLCQDPLAVLLLHPGSFPEGSSSMHLPLASLLGWHAPSCLPWPVGHGPIVPPFSVAHSMKQYSSWAFGHSGQLAASQSASCQSWQPEAMVRSITEVIGGGDLGRCCRQTVFGSPVPDHASLIMNGKGRTGWGEGRKEKQKERKKEGRKEGRKEGERGKRERGKGRKKEGMEGKVNEIGREGGREGEKKERKEGPQTLHSLDTASEDALKQSSSPTLCSRRRPYVIWVILVPLTERKIPSKGNDCACQTVAKGRSCHVTPGRSLPSKPLPLFGNLPLC